MKCFTLNILIILTMIISSCNSSVKNSVDNTLHFTWEIGGKIPNLPDGKPSPGLAGAAIGVNNNVLMIGGGANFSDGMPWNGGKKRYQHDIFIFKKENDSLINIPGDFHLPYPLAYSANCSIDKGIVAAGGENMQGPTDSVLLIDWDQKANKPVISYLPNLPRPCTDGAMAADGDKMYFAGGIDSSGVSDGFYMLNLKDTVKGWQILPALPKPVSHTVLYVQNNGTDTCIYLVGGRKENNDAVSDLYNEVYQFDLKTNQWSQKTSLPYALSAHTGVSWGDNSLLVFSGDQGKTFHATELLLTRIPREKNPAKKQALIEEKNELQKHHPGYNGNVLLYNTKTNQWMKTDSIPFPGQVTTTAVKWDNEIIIPCGEIKAGVRTPDMIVGRVSE